MRVGGGSICQEDGGGRLRYENGHSRCPWGVGVEARLVETLWGVWLEERGLLLRGVGVGVGAVHWSPPPSVGRVQVAPVSDIT